MEQSTALLTVTLILVALAVVMQAAAMLGIWLSIRKIPAQIENIRVEFKQRFDPLAQSMQEIVNNSREPMRTVTTNLAEISRMLRDRTAQFDTLAGEVVDKTRLQIIRVDQMISDMVEKFESTADSVQKGVLTPIKEMSAVFKGIRSGMEFLFSKRRVVDVTEATQDEQLFI